VRLQAVSRDTFCKHLKTFLFAGYWYVQRVRGFTTMSSINLSFTYLLYFSEFRWIYHSSQIFRRCVPCGEIELCVQSCSVVQSLIEGWNVFCRHRWTQQCSSDTLDTSRRRLRACRSSVWTGRTLMLLYNSAVLFWWDPLQFLGSRIPKISHRTLKQRLSSAK